MRSETVRRWRLASASALGLTALLLAALITPASAAPPKYKDDPSTWSLRVADDLYLVFKFPQRVFLCPFNELSGNVATRWSGRGLHWQLIAHPTSRGTNAHLWAETIEPVGKLVDHARAFLADSKMTTPYNEVTWKPEKVDKFSLSVGGKAVVAYTATYKTKLLSTLAQTSFEPSGTFWMLDIGASRVVLQVDSFRENFDAADLMKKALSTSKTPVFTDLKILQTTTTAYRFLSMPWLSPAALNEFPEGALVSWTFTAPDGTELASIRLRQTLLGGTDLADWQKWALSGLKTRNIENAETLLVPFKLGDRQAFKIDFQTKTDDAKKRDCWIHQVFFLDGTYMFDIYAASYDADKSRAAPFWAILDKALGGLLVWNAQ